MQRFALTRKAKEDLRAIAVFTEQMWGREQRNVYVKQFDEVFHMLSATPRAGKVCSHIAAGYRKFPQGSHVIFYKSGTATSVEIIRILHKSMDVDAQFPALD